VSPSAPGLVVKFGGEWASVSPAREGIPFSRVVRGAGAGEECGLDRAARQA